VGLGFDL
jgi:hypothetical protein